MAPGLDDQLAGLLDRHEEPGDLGVGHRDRAAALDLGPEQRDDRTAAAQHVAEPHAQVGARGRRARRGP